MPVSDRLFSLTDICQNNLHAVRWKFIIEACVWSSTHARRGEVGGGGRGGTLFVLISIMCFLNMKL